MEAVRWGVLGVSGHYKLRLREPLAASGMTRVRAIASRSADKAAAAARLLGIPKAYGSYAALLEDREIEAVYIPLPNHLHAQWVKAAARAGKHILCEKPFAMNAAEAADAVSCAREKGVLLMEAFMYRFHPQWKRARQIVQSGELGAIHAIHTFFSYSNHDPQNIRNVLSAGGGAIPDIGSYAVSSARFLLGREPLRVTSLVQRDASFATDVLTSAMVDFGDARALFTIGTQTHPHQRVDVIGSEGRLTLTIPFNMYPDVPAKITVDAFPSTRTITFPPVDQYALLFDAFSEAVRAGGPVPFDAEDAVANMKVLDALYRSEKSGGWEPVG
jgi:predicted dehydrogenase